MFSASSSRIITSNVDINGMIHIPHEIWLRTWGGLRTRGAGIKESAAVWAGSRQNDLERVDGVYFLDDYAGGEQHRAYHRVPVEALARFFADLRRDRRVILADLHTHPGSWVGLSPLDKENPIEFRKGLPAIVLPCFAQGKPSFGNCGVHLYEGEGRWRRLAQCDKNRLFIFN